MKYNFNKKEGIYDFVFKIQGNDVFILLTNIGNLASFFYSSYARWHKTEVHVFCNKNKNDTFILV